MTLNYPIVRLLPGKEALAASRHPWIFDGALDPKRSEAKEAGPVVVQTAQGAFVGVGTFNPGSAIRVRVLSFAPRPLDEDFFAEAFARAAALRATVVPKSDTGYRLVNAEGDHLPGLIADWFDGHLMVQVGTPGMAGLQDAWLPALLRTARPRSVWLKPDQHLVNRERFELLRAVLHGEPPEVATFQENGLTLQVTLGSGQKTGYFFDQRDNRALVARLCQGRSMFDGFCYHGGFALAAARLGAARVVGVDRSEAAIETARANALANELSHTTTFIEASVGDALRQTSELFDVVVLDPPALAKKRQHLDQAARAYKDLFMWGLKRLAPGGFLLACSCSAAVDAKLFDQILFAAAKDASRTASVLARRGAAPDHPVSLYHPQGEYLKVVLLYVS
ncbi:MAG: class I SAM-dependent rRNA methyltransferase [Myxococcota bacterium]|jgi:23S rRNA (cytosine1962-C5)-methyltransferase|nr:class I SAM-dependent rRNA methyltransferase [Myxococcota bacterium]